MNDVGKLIEEQRRRRGLSRGELAQRIGVSVQTVLNLERGPDYNLGTRLLRRIEAALGGEFRIEFMEGVMNERVTMGNDEFVLYIRKKKDNCPLTNDQLGRRIWIWIRDNADGEKLVEDQPARWGATGDFVGE